MGRVKEVVEEQGMCGDSVRWTLWVNSLVLPYSLSNLRGCLIISFCLTDFQGSVGPMGPIGPSGIPGPVVCFYLQNGYFPLISLWYHSISFSFLRVFPGVRAYMESKVIRWFKYLHYHRDNIISH